MKKEDLIAPQTYNIVSEIEKYAENPAKEAILFENEAGETQTITYANLIKNANRVGHVFLNHGLTKGDKVLILMPRAIETYEIYLAALKLGLVIIPSSEMLRTKDLQHRISHGEVSAVVAIAEHLDEFTQIAEYDELIKFVVGGQAEHWHDLTAEKQQASTELAMVETSRDDIALLSYTSGTTAKPKAVIHSHGWGYAHMQTAPKYWLSIEEGDTAWATAAPGWQKWVWSPFLSIMGSGGKAFVYNGKFNAEKYLELLQKHEVNVLCCTPTEYRLMAKLPNLSDYDLSQLHSAVSAGEPLNQEVIEQFRKNFDLTVRDGYGQTENTLLIGSLKGTETRIGSMGRAILGDRARVDEDGYFWFEGRRDDIIISSGYTIGPFEVEDSLIGHPAVKECAVVAKPHDIRGNIVKAFVILQDNYSADDALVKDLQNYVKQDVAPYKYPREIEFVTDLPKTNSGKIRRVELREAEIAKYNNQ